MTDPTDTRKPIVTDAERNEACRAAGCDLSPGSNLPRFNAPGLTVLDYACLLRRVVIAHLANTGACDSEDEVGGRCTDPRCTYCNLERALHPVGWEPRDD